MERLPPPGPGRHGRRFLVIVCAGGGVLIAAASLSGRHLDGADWARLGSGLLIVALVALRFATSRRPLGGMAMQALLLFAFGVALVIGYSYKDELHQVSDRALGTISPGRGIEAAPGVMRFSADNSGQFVVDAEVNGIGVQFLMDTGASGVILSRRDATRLGLQPDRLGYTARFSTANGGVRAAPVTLDSLHIGPLTAHAVPAWVNGGDLDQSLLGMSYLSRLGRIEIKGDTLILEAPDRTNTD